MTPTMYPEMVRESMREQRRQVLRTSRTPIVREARLRRRVSARRRAPLAG